ncbi:hypothetical protein MNEG_1199 [Monoraphidium neglectum]|uniref:Protein kinase domain-containing protein n=1 Tax=Monoraphidium neglectum TaxID=145388 RepID=A0A0D2LK51_9CHLO|nr:hypothetical protein MNEG_1199 [Monoraphidium neglectum]KIZ06754.1 hypothetical protein MNEG_1199 [Monoraphidium neglectum]|eukprot:XP_013905773.1 hypothetical protein MNEG_1199 [Monoraphidium neglectum]
MSGLSDFGQLFSVHTQFSATQGPPWVFSKAAMASSTGLLKQAVAEVQLHEKLQREVLRDGVPRLLAAHEDETHLHLVFEYGGTSLIREIATLSDEDRAEVGDAIVAAATRLLARMHGKDCDRRYNDFKPEQLLLTRRPAGAGFQVNVCDLGAATPLGSHPTACTPTCAPPEAGPEMLKYIARLPHPNMGNFFGVKYDSWALGATLVLAVLGFSPWETPEARALADDYDAYDSAVVACITAAPRAYATTPSLGPCLRTCARSWTPRWILTPPRAPRAWSSASATTRSAWASTTGPRRQRRRRCCAARRSAAAELADADAARASKVKAFFEAATAAIDAADQRSAVLQCRVASLEGEAQASAVREVRKDEAAAAAAAAHAAEVAALSAAAVAAAQREAALQGHVAALEAEVLRKNEAATVALMAAHAALADERTACQLHVSALQARLVALEVAGRAAVAEAAAAEEGSWGGGVCGTSRTSSVCSSYDGGGERALDPELLASRPGSPRLSQGSGCEEGEVTAREQEQQHAHTH